MKKIYLDVHAQRSGMSLLSCWYVHSASYTLLQTPVERMKNTFNILQATFFFSAACRTTHCHYYYYCYYYYYHNDYSVALRMKPETLDSRTPHRRSDDVETAITSCFLSCHPKANRHRTRFAHNLISSTEHQDSESSKTKRRTIC